MGRHSFTLTSHCTSLLAASIFNWVSINVPFENVPSHAFHNHAQLIRSDGQTRIAMPLQGSDIDPDSTGCNNAMSQSDPVINIRGGIKKKSTSRQRRRAADYYYHYHHQSPHHYSRRRSEE